MDKAGRLGMAVHQAASFSPPLMGMTASRAVFWPGCALMSLDPAILERPLAVLRREERDVDAILERKGGYAPALAEMVEREAVSFVGDLFGTLRERGMDLRTGLTIFTGGGAILLRRIIENTGKVGRCLYVTDINPNAKGLAKHYLATEQGA